MTGETEYKLPSGETITITVNGEKYYVDCWDSNDENRWHKEFSDKAEAIAEYNRWRP